MLLFRLAILIALVASGVLFAIYGITSERRFRRYGLITLGWTLFAALIFFGVLIADRLAD